MARSRQRRRHRLFRPILRPFPGHKLPPDLRVGGVEKIACALPEGLADPGFEVLLRRIDGAPFFGGNRVDVFFNGRDAFGAMRASGEAAEKEILLESYIFKDDSTGRQFLASLRSAAERGLTVRVLADALGSSSTRAEFWQEMESHGIEVHLFHPMFKGFWYQPFRDHRKILVLDRKVAFTGGMNIGEEYGSIRRRPKPGETWRDTHVRVTGPAAWQMAVVFSEGWVHSDGEMFEIDPLPASEADRPGSRIMVLDSRPNRGQAESAAALAAISSASRKTLWITNAYFAPGRRGIDLLGRRRGAGRRRAPPPARQDRRPIVRRAGHGYYGQLLERGVRIFEYQAAILHAKTLVADGYVSVVGSTNLDFRSFVFNNECDLLMLCPSRRPLWKRPF